MIRMAVVLGLVAASWGQVFAQQIPIEVAPPPRKIVLPGPLPVDVKSFLLAPSNPVLSVIERYEEDRGSLARTYFVAASPDRLRRFQQFYLDWRTAVGQVLKRGQLTREVRDELAKFHERILQDETNLLTEAAKRQAVREWMPFASGIVALEDARRELKPIKPRQQAGELDQWAKQIRQLSKALPDKAAAEMTSELPTKLRYVQAQVQQLTAALQTWHTFYNGYDPLFTWWMAEPYKELTAALVEYQEALRKMVAGKPDEPWSVKPLSPSVNVVSADLPNVAELLATPRGPMRNVLQRYESERGGRRFSRGEGNVNTSDRTKSWLAGLEQVDFAKLSQADQIDYILFKNHLLKDVQRAELRAKNLPTPKAPRDASGIGGRPIGAEALALELRLEMVPYQADELIQLAQEEYEWCLKEMKAASREMGFGDDWKAAIEKVKQTAVEPGEQPKMVRDLALEAIEYMTQQQLVTVPPLAAETWRMTMMSPQQQLFSPFFLGGETIIVAYPTNTMSHEAKLQSIRGNNPHFSRATVQHELIPGHHLQQFQQSRYATHRQLFRTPLWPEGMAVYWEMVLYDRGFPRGPEDRIGMMFWRMHRCARVIFSFGYHLGTMTPQQCIDFLIDKAGHERDNATAEVRRSFTGGYGPLYQAAYLIGAMQFRALRKELVDSGTMTEKAFHDALYQLGPIPVEMIRAALTRQRLTADFQSQWRFAELKK